MTASRGELRIARVLSRLSEIRALRIAHQIGDEHGRTVRVLLSRDRHKTVIHARHQLWTVVRHTLNLSYPELAELFEVDHTTVLYAVHKREGELAHEYRPA